jgi:LmbE family N-acetylglucosaminyl deacetylase
MAFDEKRFNAAPYVAAGSAVLAGYLAYRRLSRMLGVKNPDVALRHGANITRRASRVMAVSAHQDDLEYLAGGTLRLLGLAGGEITCVVATGGERQRHQRGNAAAVRGQEQRDAGIILGYDRVRFLHFSDLSLAHNPNLEPLLGDIWDELKPDLVLVMDPTFPLPFIVHPDHLAVGRAILTLSRTRVKGQTEVLFYGSRDPNVLVDISGVMEDKIQGVLAHKSQLKTRPWLYGMLLRAYGRMARYNAGVAYGEPFRSLTLPALDRRAYMDDWPASEPRPEPVLVDR